MSTLLELLQPKNLPKRELECLRNETWNDAMLIFPLIHKALDNQDAVRLYSFSISSCISLNIFCLSFQLLKSLFSLRFL